MGLPAGISLPLGERLFGKYELLSKLATGGMAEIFLARPIGSSKDDLLVIKRVLPHLEDEERFVAMFRDEARLASQIQHRNVCNVFEAGEVNQRNFIAMEYMFGVALSNILTQTARANTPMDPRIATGILVQACQGLQSAHELRLEDGSLLNLVHRDMTPSNIFVTSKGVVKVLDFGVAKAHGATQKTRTGTLKGKNAYMSPEQILSKDLDRRSDIFSLGVVLWESLTARRLFARSSDFLTFRAITEDDIPSVSLYRPGVPEELTAVLRQALARVPTERFSTALEFKDAVEHVMQNYGGVASGEEIANYIQSGFSKELDKSSELCSIATSIDVATPLPPHTLPLRAPIEDIDSTIKKLPPSEASTKIGTLSSHDFDSTKMRKLEAAPNIVVNDSSEIDIRATAFETIETKTSSHASARDTTWDEETDSSKSGGLWFLAGLVFAVVACAAAAFLFLNQGDKEVIAKGAALPGEVAQTEDRDVRESESKNRPPEMVFVLDNDDKEQNDKQEGTESSTSPKNKKLETLSDVSIKESKSSVDEVTKKRKTSSKEKAKVKKQAKNTAPAKVEDTRPGTFSINSFPYATIYVDGKNIGVTPILYHKLPAGPHRVRAVTKDGASKNFKIKIQPNRLLNKGEITFR